MDLTIEEAIKWFRENPFCHKDHVPFNMAIKALEQESKILDTLDFAIDASNGDTNYFVGFRNGLRYAKSLIDGEEPQYESCAEQAPKTGHWIRGKYSDDDFRYNNTSYKCDKCGKVADFKENFCPNCGAKMESEGKE